MHLLQETLFYFHIKATKLVKKCSVKGVIIKPYMFWSLFNDHSQGSSFVLSAPTTYQPPASSFVFFGFVAVCPLLVCVSGVLVCVLSGRANTQTGTPDTHTNRGHMATNPKKTNDEAGGVSKLSTNFRTNSFVCLWKF
jgi:hypothetical protein